MPSLYEYLKLVLLPLCTCATTLATDSPSKIPALHHRNLLKHRVPPPDSSFDYSTLQPCADHTVSSNPLHGRSIGIEAISPFSRLSPTLSSSPKTELHILCDFFFFFLAMNYMYPKKKKKSLPVGSCRIASCGRYAPLVRKRRLAL